MFNPDQWAAMREFLAGVERQFNEVREQMAPALLKFAEGMQEAAVGFQRYRETTARLYPQVKAMTVPLAERGWFLSLYFGTSEFMELGVKCETSTLDDVERHVVDMYRSSVDEHATDLVRDYPDRAFAIKPAVDAHNRGEYALSVPLFFAQAEGISVAAINKYIFKGGKTKGDVDESIKAAAMERLQAIKDAGASAETYGMLSTLVEIMWLPFAEPRPVAYSERQREDKRYQGLNRHTVMHGIALAEYATEENSLRAFSMLSAVGSIMHELTEREKDYPWTEKPKI